MFFYNISDEHLLMLFLVGIPLHLVWLLASLKYNPLYLLCIVSMILTPFSIAVDAAPIIVMLKYGRVYISLLMAAIGLLMMLMRGKRFGAASGAFLAFSVYLWATGAYSEYPTEALLDRVRLLVLVIAGICMGLTLNSLRELRSGLQALMLGVYGWAGLLIAGVVLTGSRGGMGAMVLGSLVILAPLVRRPVVLITVGAVAVVIGYLAAPYLLGADAVERLTSVHNTRAGVWQYTFERFLEAPVFGHGLLTEHSMLTGGRQGFNAHSIYFTVLLNQGIVGILLFGATLFVMGRQYLRVLHGLKDIPFANRWPAYMGLGMMTATLSYGLVEVAPITGVSIYSLALGLSVGLADWILAPASQSVPADEQMPSLAHENEPAPGAWLDD